jgi:hypothetical protein
MRVNRFVLGTVVGFTVLASGAACSGGSDSGAGASGAGAAGFHPPATVDAVVCASVTGDELDSATLQKCGDCCSAASFDESTLYESKCVCGQSTTDDTVCKTQPDAACSSCCTNAGFNASGFFGNPGMSDCSCTGKFDNKVCASTLSAADPEPACRTCCLNNGYLGEAFTGFGTLECNCL